MRDPKDATYSPKKNVQLGFQLEKVLKSKKKKFGKISIPLQNYANDEQKIDILLPIEKTSIDKPPKVRIVMKASWISLDGHLLKPIPAGGATPSGEEPKRRRGFTNLLPSSKVTINNKTYELYESDIAEESPNVDQSLMDNDKDQDSELDFTCDVPFPISFFSFLLFLIFPSLLLSPSFALALTDPSLCLTSSLSPPLLPMPLLLIPLSALLLPFSPFFSPLLFRFPLIAKRAISLFNLRDHHFAISRTDSFPFLPTPLPLPPFYSIPFFSLC